MSKLLWSLSSIDTRVCPLVFVIRRWAREASITQSTPGPWFSNFQMTLLVLFYLQSIEILPKLNYVNEQSSILQDSSSTNSKICSLRRQFEHKCVVCLFVCLFVKAMI